MNKPAGLWLPFGDAILAALISDGSVNRESNLRIVRVIVMLLTVVACGDAPVTVERESYRSADVTFASRGVDVPATFVRPGPDIAAPYPVVVMAHGHGGSRDEAGGFRRLAEALARRGIATIRPDFSGCGQSSEPFTRNNLTNMLADTRAALDYARRQPGVDTDRAGIVGYSMGGRVAMLLSPDGFAAAVLWAPAGLDGPDTMFSFLGGEARYAELRSEARRDGFAPFVTPWGQRQALDLQWFHDLETYRPMAALATFTGALLVISGAEDDIIEPEIARAVAAAATGSSKLRLEVLDGTGHGLGFYDDEPAVSERVIAATADFLVSELLRDR